MTPELLTQATNIFDSYDKWNAFIELSNVRNLIKDRYFEELKLGLSKHFINDVRQDWLFRPDHQYQYRWYLKDYGAESICILMNINHIYLWCNPQLFDANLIKEYLNSPEYLSIFSCFDFTDTLSSPNLHHFCEERHRFNFNDSTSYPTNNEINHDKLSWFAGNKTEEMVQQIAVKINRFRTPEISKLLLELNQKCKK